jgi:hypothetical protein
VLTTAADDDARSATLLGADARVEIDADSDEDAAEDDDDSDAVDAPECLALNPAEA